MATHTTEQKVHRRRSRFPVGGSTETGVVDRRGILLAARRLGRERVARGCIQGTLRAHDDVIKRETTRNAEMHPPQVRYMIDATCLVSATRQSVLSRLSGREPALTIRDLFPGALPSATLCDLIVRSDGHMAGTSERHVVSRNVDGSRRRGRARVDLVETVGVWPPEETKPTLEEMDRLPEDSPWNTDVWLVELGDRVRDAFAEVNDYALPSVADEWARIGEFGGHLDAAFALYIVESFVALARRARQANDRLYCWACL